MGGGSEGLLLSRRCFPEGKLKHMRKILKILKKVLSKITAIQNVCNAYDRSNAQLPRVKFPFAQYDR